MDFDLTQEQAQLADTLRRWVAREYDFERRRKIVASKGGTSADAWQSLAELGLLALPVPEAQGGFGASGIDMFAVMQELGRGLVVEPYLSTVTGVEFLKHDADRHAGILRNVAAGAAKIACALGEEQSRHTLSDVATTAIRVGGEYVIDGRKTVIVDGTDADWLIVSARTAGEQRDADGISLFLVAAGSNGVSCQAYPAVDGRRVADITLSGLHVPVDALIGTPGAAWTVIDAVWDYANSLACAEALGVMEALYEVTLDYIRTRHQFEQPIGRFQALQHRMVDIFIQLEQARSMAMLAAARARADDAESRRHTISAAMVRIQQAARVIGQEAIQLHGGIGMTNELPAANYFKKLTTLGMLEGDVDHHIARFVRQPGFAMTG